MNSHLQRKSFNDVHDIVRLLNSIGLDTQPLSPSLQKLETVIKRRHEIVHSADRVSVTGAAKPTDINPTEVRVWLESIQVFISMTLAHLDAMKVAKHGLANIDRNRFNVEIDGDNVRIKLKTNEE